MKIKSKIKFVDGNFDTKKGELVCVKSEKWASVDLCFKSNLNIQFASIRLYSTNRLVDAQETFEDACKLGDEIVRRWNESPTKK